MEINSKFFFSPLCFVTILLLFNSACTPQSTSENQPEELPTIDSVEVEEPIDSVDNYIAMLEELGMVDLYLVDSSIVVDLKYNSQDNFLDTNLYSGFDRCYMQKEVANALSKAQRLLKNIDNTMSIIVFDAVRPRSVQQTMWDNVKASDADRKKFLSSPNKVSMHNMGLAVDVSIMLADSTLLDMGTEFDHIGELAYPVLGEYFVEQGVLGYNQVNNRAVLKSIMEDAGFKSNKYEWWHYSYFDKDAAMQRYAIVENFSSFTKPHTHEHNSEVTSVFLGVQIAASRVQLNGSQLCVSQTKEYYHHGMYKYYAGKFNDLSQAYRFRDSILNKTCSSAFVVAFIDNKRVHITEALSEL